MSPAALEADGHCRGCATDFSGGESNMDVSELVKRDDSTLKALGLILEAWEEGAESGVAPEIMAYAAFYAALTDLVAAFGEDCVADMALGLAKRVNAGEFTLYQTRQ